MSTKTVERDSGNKLSSWIRDATRRLLEQLHVDFDLDHAVLHFVPPPGPAAPQPLLGHGDPYYRLIGSFEKLSQGSY